MEVNTQKKPGKLDFKFLPGFAAFILEYHHEAFVREQLRISKEVKLPLLLHLDQFDENQLIRMSLNTTQEFLEYLARNEAHQQIENAYKKWMSDKLPVLSRDQIISDDITLFNYVRKKSFLKFLPEYVSDLTESLQIIDEVDRFLLESETVSVTGYIRLLKNKINEEMHFKERIVNTTPGIVYVYDLFEKKTLYVNEKVGYYLGYDEKDVSSSNGSFFSKILHADDMERAKEHIHVLKLLKEKEIKTFEYRAKSKNGVYIWFRTYESVFRMNEDGTTRQIIGTAIDINNEKDIQEQLAYREAQLLEAQEFAHLGSFEWDLVNNTSTVTPELINILEVEHTPLETFMSHVHPADKELVETSLQEAIEKSGNYNAEFRYVINGKQKSLWSRGVVAYDGEGKPLSLRGTVMDVSERQRIIEQLKKSEERFKQAQATTHIGNYVLDLETNNLEWSDEMYRIYGLQEGSEISKDVTETFRHPDDKDYVEEQLRDAIEAKQPFDFHYRIILRDQSLKILHARGEVEYQNSKPSTVHGTIQDVTERQHLIERLQQSEALYKQAQALSHIGNWSIDLENNSIYWTDEMYRIYGLDPQSAVLSYETFMELVHPEDRELVKAFTYQAISAKAPFDMYHRNQWKDGTIKSLHIRGEVVADKNGKAIQIFGTAQDVTHQQLTEQQLRENRNFIQKITDATPSIITSYNVNTGKYRFVSQGITKLLGYGPEEPMEQGVVFFVGLIHPDDLQPLLDKNNAALQAANESETELNDIIVDWQYRMRNSAGEYRWFHSFGTVFDRNAEGKVEHVLNISIDITDKIEAEKKVLEQEFFIKHIADASPTVLYLFDAIHGKVIYINKEIESVLGYTPDEMIRMGEHVVQEIYHPEDAVLIPQRLHEYNNSTHPQSLFQFECRMKHRDGKWRWLLIREIVFKRDSNGKILEVLGAALDISRRKEVENMLMQKTRELEQSNASLEEFAYVASHDLKEPLRKISTFGDRLIITQKEKLDSEGRNFLDKIIDSSRRMQQMINDLLSVSLIVAEKTFEETSLQALLDDVIQTLEFKIEESKAILDIQPLPAARVIPSQFRQVFQNLMSNSLKFIRPGVQLVITVRYDYLQPGSLTITNITKASRYLRISFTDNGIGFDDAFTEKVFAMFQRLHNKREYEGTGIGLSICKKIIENHGGLIIAESKPDKGSTFTIIIPV